MLETQRLVLRPFEPGDLEAYAAIRSKPSVARFLPGGEAGARDAGARIRASETPWGRDVWASGGFAPWAVIEKASAQLIGHLGLRYLAEVADTELLYMIDEPWWGRGLVTEGGLAAVDFARDRLGKDRLLAFVVPDNCGSISVVRKLGFRVDGQQSIFGLDMVRYVLNLGRGPG
jgi:RimJ/RimL family protein N-acetyltransferase